MTNKTERKGVIYARVSTREQDPFKQVNELNSFAFQQNIKVHKVYIDKISGTKSRRPQLNQLMMDAKKHLFDVVLVWKLDRLGRSLQHLIQVINNFNNYGIDFICTTQNINTTTSDGKLVFHIMGAMAEFESDLISERTKMGLKNAKNVGKRGKDKKKRKKSGYYLRYAKGDSL